MTNTPHNNFFITVFSDREIVIDLITQLLPELSAKIQIDTLTLDNTNYVNDELNDLYSDIVYNVDSQKGMTFKISLLFEHKSYQVSYPRFQLLDYIQGIWRNNVKNKESLTLVVPIIFYHNKAEWKYRTLASYFEGIDDDLRSYLPDFKYLLIDLNDYSDEVIISLKRSFLINALLAFKHKSDSEYVKQNARKIYQNFELYEDSDRKEMFIRSLTVYIINSTTLNSKDMTQIVNTLPPQVQPTIKTTYQNLIEEGIEKGIEKERKRQEKERRRQEKERRRQEQKNILETTITAIKMKMDNESISILLQKRISTENIKLIEGVVSNNSENQEVNMDIIKDIYERYSHLESEDLKELFQLTIEEARAVKEAKNR